jgi:hypothetical protein
MIVMELNASSSKPLSDEEWMAMQMRSYGPLLGGAALRTFLGFRSQAAFAKARASGSVGVLTFPIPGRKGVYAFTTDACQWALALRRQGSH